MWSRLSGSSLFNEEYSDELIVAIVVLLDKLDVSDTLSRAASATFLRFTCIALAADILLVMLINVCVSSKLKMGKHTIIYY